MIPNFVQRRRNEPRMSDHLLADKLMQCAQEGGTFRDPVPARAASLSAEYFDGPRIRWSRVWLGVCLGAVLLTCFAASVTA